MPDSEKILLNDETIHNVSGLSEPDLEVWVRGRFDGHDPYFLDPMKDEFPGDKVAWIYREHNEDDSFRQNLEAIAEKLLKETLKAKEPDLVKAYQILDMMESGRFDKPSAYIRILIDSENYKGKQTVYGDIHEKLLLTLISMKVPLLGEDFWRQQMSDLRYISTAFVGLFLQLKPNYKTLMEDFKELIKKKLEHPEYEVEIDFILSLFIDYMEKDNRDFCKLAQEYFQYDPDELRVLEEELALFDKHLPLLIRVPVIPVVLKRETKIVFLCLTQNKPSRTLHHSFHCNP